MNTFTVPLNINVVRDLLLGLYTPDTGRDRGGAFSYSNLPKDCQIQEIVVDGIQGVLMVTLTTEEENLPKVATLTYSQPEHSLEWVKQQEDAVVAAMNYPKIAPFMYVLGEKHYNAVFYSALVARLHALGVDPKIYFDALDW